jgi:hypothetical protein
VDAKSERNYSRTVDQPGFIAQANLFPGAATIVRCVNQQLAQAVWKREQAESR